MKKLHLICNAHLDPIWLWEWEEGAASALSTFRSAVNLAGEFDYIFCHNEVTLYRWIEEYDPNLFRSIQELVKQGKWHVIGGWYLQPDCNLPSGESFIRQVMEGRKYFSEHFNVKPTTAVNFDPFGHSAGLVQILRKCGYDSYLCCRPSPSELPIPDDFLWEGPDGSVIRAKRASGHYNSTLGEAVKKIAAEEARSDRSVDLVLWGVGNHGGGPSRKDLAEIGARMGSGETELIHSTPEAYFADCKEVPSYVHRGGINFCMPGCLTSMVRVKQLHRELENQLYFTEKMLSHADAAGVLAYPQEEVQEAVYDLLNAEFHDVLPGTVIRPGEEYGIRLMHHGLEILNRLRARAFFALSRGEKPAKPGEFPILVYNPHPYSVRACVDVGFNLEEQNYEESFTDIEAYCGNSKLPTQVVKEKSNLNLDWMKRVRFFCELKPSSVSRFDCKKKLLAKRPVLPLLAGDAYVFQSGGTRIAVNLVTGLVKSISRDGREYLLSPAFSLKVYADNEDPWAMGVKQRERLGEYEGVFQLMTPEDGSRYSGVFDRVIPSVRLVEDGEVLTEIEAVFRYRDSTARVGYIFYKQSEEFDVNTELQFAEKNRTVRMSVPTAIPGETLGQIAFGTEKVDCSGAERVMHRWVARRSGQAELALVNNGVYGVRCEGNEIAVTLLRSAAYSAHPIRDRRITPEDRYTPRIDQGERNYSFRVLFGEARAVSEKLERAAEVFNEAPFALNVFPAGNGTESIPGIVLTDGSITMPAWKKSEQGGYIVRLFNNSDSDSSCQLRCELLEAVCKISFRPYEVKTFRLTKHKAQECEQMEI